MEENIVQLTEEEKDEIITHLLENNGWDYNLSKASEEFQELALALTQRLNKPTMTPDQAIIDEIGDCRIRLRILENLFPLDKIKERENYKLNKFMEYIREKSYNRM